jgi:hypothetical protein
MSKHTPGPWFENVMPTSAGSAITINSADHRIAIIYVDGIRKGIDDELPRSIQNRANARLIAAAPELLEALKNYVNGCSVGVNATEVARAAIAKAEGK